MSGQDRVIDSLGFGAEDQPIAIAKIGLPQAAGAAGTEEPEAICLRDDIEERSRVVVHRELQSRPVIHRAAFEFPIRQDKAEWPNQVKLRARRDTQAGDIAGIGGDLGLEEDDLQSVWRKVQHRIHADRAADAGDTSFPPGSAWMSCEVSAHIAVKRPTGESAAAVSSRIILAATIGE